MQSLKKIQRGWYFYDWANSAYPLVINTAIFPIYYSMVTRTEGSDTVHFLGGEYLGSSLYSYVIALSFIIISALTPLLGGIADYSGSKKSFMRFFCYLGSAACMGLAFFDHSNLGYGLICSALAIIGFSGLVFYNAYLPEIAPPDQQDSVSARGYAMGYIGSSLLLIACLAVVKMRPDNAEWFLTVAPYTFIAVGVWWFGFSHITFARLPRGTARPHGGGTLVGKGFRGENEVGLQSGDLIVSVLLIQFVAVAGSWLFAKLSGRLGRSGAVGMGNVRALVIALIIWIGVCVGAYFFVYDALSFFVIGSILGLVLGGTQSLARATYSKLLPETEDHASFFSFMDVCEKTGIVIGMFSYGAIADFTGSMRSAIVVLTAFFIAGLIVLLFVGKNLRRGHAAHRKQHEAAAAQQTIA
jgi:UMF1 family MFS transporter